MQAEILTAGTMKEGIHDSSIFVLFASKSYPQSSYCRMELCEALQSQKSILVVFDAIDNTDAFLKNMYDGIQKDDLDAQQKGLVSKVDNPYQVCRTMTFETFQQALSERVEFGLRRGSVKRETMLNSIVRKATGETLPSAVHVEINDTEVFIVGHPTTGANQCELIAIEMSAHGVRAEHLEATDNVEGTIMEAGRMQALIVYLTDETLIQSHVKQACDCAKKANKTIVCVFESDGRREGVNGDWNGILKSQALGKPGYEHLASLLNDDCLAFAQDTRRGPELELKIGKIAARCGTSTLIDLPPSFDPYRLPRQKATEYEQGTRMWLMDKVVLENQRKNATFLLSNAGMGKSTVFGELAMEYCPRFAEQSGNTVKGPEMNIGALHFFLHSQRDGRDIKLCFKSIARQLCCSLPGFRYCLAQSKEELDKSIEKTDRETYPFRELLKLLIIDPANKLQETFSGTVKRTVILIDAIDECESPELFTDAIASCWNDAPSWLILAASSRPQYLVKENLKEFGPFLLAPTAEENLQDLKQFLTARMENKWNVLDNTQSQLLVDAVVEQSEGVFLWLAFQQQELKRLAETNTLTVEAIHNLPKGISKTYQAYFERLLNSLKGDDDKYQLSLSLALLVPRATIPENIWKHALGFDDSTRSLELEYQSVRDAISSLLIFDVDGTMKAPHKSMSDWILGKDDESAKLKLRVRCTEQHHKILAQELERIFATRTVKDWIVSVENKEEEFAFSHAFYHWTESKCFKESSEGLLDIFHLFRLVSQNVHEKTVDRLIQDVDLFLARFENVADDIEGRISKAKLGRSILRFVRPACQNDPRELAAQILGRVGIPPFDDNRQYWIDQAEKWLRSARELGGLKIAQPVNFGFSGLQPAGGSVIQVIPRESSVNCIAVDKNDQIYTGCSNNAYVYDKYGNLIRTLKGHSQDINAIAVSFDGKRVFTGSAYPDNTARIWDVESGRQLNVLIGHSSSVNAIAVSSDGKRVFTGSADHTVIIWDVENGLQLKVLEGHSHYINAIAVSLDGKIVFTGSTDKTARIWDVESGQQLKVLEGHSDAIRAIAVSLDGKRVFTGSEDQTVIIWDVESGQQLNVLKGHSNFIAAIAVSFDGKRVFTGSWDKTARIWDVESGEQSKVLIGHSGDIWAIAVSFDGKRVFTGSVDHTTIIWDVESGQQPEVLKGHSRSIVTIVVSSNGKRVFTGSYDNTARIWDVESGQQLKVLHGHSDVIWAIAVSSDGKRVFTGSRDKTAIIWDAESGQQLNVLKGHSSNIDAIVVSSDGKRVFTGSSDGTVIIWDVESGRQLNVLKGHSHPIKAIAVSSDGQFLMTRDILRVEIVWNISTGEQLKEMKTEKIDWCHDDVKGVFKMKYDEFSVGMTLEGLDKQFGVRNIVGGKVDKDFICWRLS